MYLGKSASRTFPVRLGASYVLNPPKRKLYGKNGYCNLVFFASSGRLWS